MKRSLIAVEIIMITLLLLVVGTLTSHSIKREEQLAGDQERIKQETFKSIEVEPQRLKAGETEKRPTLKLPEVIVKGEKKYLVSAEKKELLEIDPMKGTKEIPADITKLTMPGLSDIKNAPALTTMTTKDYLFQLEGGGGTSRAGWGDLIVGYETKHLDYIIKASYNQLEKPGVYNFKPFDQQSMLAFNAGMRLTKQWQLLLDLELDTSGHENPNHPQRINQWLHDQHTKVELINNLQLTNQTSLSIAGTVGHYRLYDGGWRWSQDDLRKSSYFQGSLDLDMTISFIKQNDLNVLVEGKVIGQKLNEVEPLSLPQELEESFSELKLRTRFQPLNMVAFDIGVKLNQFNQGSHSMWDQQIIGNLDVNLPWNATLYARLDGGLNWIQAHDLIPDHHRIGAQSLTGVDNLSPTEINEQLTVGWRQKLGPKIVLDVNWSKKYLNNYILWTNDVVDQLFAYQAIDDVVIEDIKLNMNFKPLENLNIEIELTYDQATWAAGDYVPYQPKFKGDMITTWNLKPWTLAFNYQYMGKQHAKFTDSSSMLTAAHLLDLKVNYTVNQYVDILLELNNILDYNWAMWAGYPENGLTVLLGLRLTL